MFRILETQNGVQTGMLQLKPGEVSGPIENQFPGSAQTVVVLRGEIDAEIGEMRVRMREGDSVIVRRDVVHRFTGASDEEAVTLHLYDSRG